MLLYKFIWTMEEEEVEQSFKAQAPLKKRTE